MKICITGGHITPALAVVEHIQHLNPTSDIVLLGRKNTQTKTQQQSHEERLARQYNIKFIGITAPKLPQFLSWTALQAFFLLIRSIIKNYLWLRQLQPNLVLTFGGYLAIPVAVAAWLNGISVLTHEQTSQAGVANQIITRFSKKVLLSHPSSAAFFPPAKSILVGNPIRPSLLNSVKRPEWIPTSKLRILFVTGGNQGSVSINQAVFQALPDLTQHFLVIHQLGNPRSATEISPQQISYTNYLAKPWIDQDELAWIYQQQPVVISRAGANTLTELSAFKLPAVIIPLPNSHRQEQQRNAESFIQDHSAILLPQTELNVSNLITSAHKLATASTQTKPDLSSINQSNNKILQSIYDQIISLIAA